MTRSWEILLPTQIHPAGPESVTDFANCTSMDAYETRKAALDDIARYDAVIVRVAELDAAVIERADKLQVIAKHGTGLDNVDIEAASKRNIVVCNTPGANAQSVAEHAIALLFGVRRKLHTADRHVRSGEWERSPFRGHELRGDTLGLFGFGDIAQRTASLAQGIGMSVLAYDPYISAEDVPAEIEKIESRERLFEASDAVSIHAPLTEETKHSVSTAELAALGADNIVINTSRGAVIDEDALVTALEAGTIAGAGLDNFETEPPGANHPLYELDTALLTPHVGGVTEQALRRMSIEVVDNVRTVYEGGIPESTVNRDALTP